MALLTFENLKSVANQSPFSKHMTHFARFVSAFQQHFHSHLLVLTSKLPCLSALFFNNFYSIFFILKCHFVISTKGDRRLLEHVEQKRRVVIETNTVGKLSKYRLPMAVLHIKLFTTKLSRTTWCCNKPNLETRMYSMIYLISI